MQFMKHLLICLGVILLSATAIVAQDDRAARIAEIQTALQKEKLDGWLFYDSRGSDILTPRILKTERLGGSRRWFYFVPAKGEPVKVVHAIEPEQIDVLPGTKLIATHDLELVLDTCSRVLVLDGGKLFADGPAGKLLADAELMERHGLEVPYRLRSPDRS